MHPDYNSTHITLCLNALVLSRDLTDHYSRPDYLIELLFFTNNFQKISPVYYLARIKNTLIIITCKVNSIVRARFLKKISPKIRILMQLTVRSGLKKEFPRHGMYAYRIVATQFALQNQRLKRHDIPL